MLLTRKSQHSQPRFLNLRVQNYALKEIEPNSRYTKICFNPDLTLTIVKKVKTNGHKKGA